MLSESYTHKFYSKSMAEVMQVKTNTPDFYVCLKPVLNSN